MLVSICRTSGLGSAPFSSCVRWLGGRGGVAWEARLLSEREHVTAHIWKHPEIFRIATIENEEDLSHIRLVVDDERDLQVVAEIYHELYKEGEVFHLRDIMSFLNKKPELLELNKRTVRNEGYQKSLGEDRIVR